MAKLYILGIGGTGSRVLRSLTMLLAAGVDTNGYDIAPIIIDPDSSNRDLTRNVQLMNKYIEIRNKLSFTNESKNTFFKTKIIRTVQNFTIPIRDTSNNTYSQFINLDGMSKADKAMAEMLFSQKNLASGMEVGFKGNPNIGSVVLNQLSTSPEFQEFVTSFGQDDKIFIISSIFGGTGASGFPLLLKTLRHNTNLTTAGCINKATIGAISVLPYFNLKKNDESEIDSSTFFSKTRAALKYYAKNVGDANALYYIGDMPKAQYANHEGGIEQGNDANLIEFLAATAVIDFCRNDFPEGQTSYREVGLNDNGGTVTLKTLPTGFMHDAFAYPLMEFMLFAKSLVDDYDFVTLEKNPVNGRLKKGIYSEIFAQNVRNFLTLYKDWLNELGNNSPSFKPFNMDGGLKELVNDVKAKENFFKKVDTNAFRSTLNDEKHIQGASEEDKLMEAYCAAATKFAKTKYQF